MATKYWIGQAEAVAQVWSASINAYDAATTYGITIGNVTISLLADTDEQTTIDALVVLLNASEHPYFSTITWARTGAGAGSAVEGTGDVVGVPFVFTTYANGGAGSWNAVVEDVDAESPNHYNLPVNWSEGSLPVGNETIVMAHNNVNICWGLDALIAINLHGFRKMKSSAGRIGLDYASFAISADGAQVEAGYAEYRDTYLKVKSDPAYKIEIGQHSGPGSPAGSPRVLIDTLNGESHVLVHDTASVATAADRCAVCLLFDNANSDLEVLAAPGAVGVGVEAPDETSTLLRIWVNATTAAARVFTGRGVELEYWVQLNGNNLMQLLRDATIPEVNVLGGHLETRGEFEITDALVEQGATFIASHGQVGPGVAIATLILNGICDSRRSIWPRTYTTVVMSKGAIFKRDPDVITVPTLTLPAGELSVT